MMVVDLFELLAYETMAIAKATTIVYTIIA